MKIYIAGPMTGLPEFNVPAFNKAADDLRAAGFEAANPADQGVSPDRTWADYMRADLRMLLDCEGVALLPGWERSTGASLEVDVAGHLDMPALPLPGWLLRGVRP